MSGHRQVDRLGARAAAVLAVLCALSFGLAFSKNMVAGITKEEAGYNPVHDASYRSYVAALQRSERTATHVSLLLLLACGVAASCWIRLNRRELHGKGAVRAIFFGAMALSASGTAGLILGLFVFG